MDKILTQPQASGMTPIKGVMLVKYNPMYCRVSRNAGNQYCIWVKGKHTTTGKRERLFRDPKRNIAFEEESIANLIAMDVDELINKGIKINPSFYSRKGARDFRFEEFAEFWLESKSIADETRGNYERNLKMTCEFWWGKDIRECTDYDFQQFINHLKKKGYTYNTVRYHRNLVSSIFKYALRLKRISELPLPPDMKREQVIRKPVDEKTRRLVLANINEYDRKIIVFMFYTGCRGKEAMQLKIKDLDLGKGLAYVRRPKERRDKRLRLDLFYDLSSMLREHVQGRDENELVFLQRNGNRYQGHSLSRIITKARKGITDQELRVLARNTYIQQCIDAGLSINETGSLVGHNNWKTTKHYYGEKDVLKIKLKRVK